MSNIIYDLFGLNKAIFIYLNHITNLPPLQTILYYISNLFYIVNFPFYYILVFTYFIIRTKLANNTEKYFTPIFYNMIKVFICYALFVITFAALKFSFNLPRPYCSLTEKEFITIINTSLQRCLSSFPSAHTGLSILIAYFLWPYANKIFRFILCATVATVAISRITLSMHYPSDILYSILITYIVIKVSNVLYKTINSAIIIKIRKCLIKYMKSKPKN